MLMRSHRGGAGEGCGRRERDILPRAYIVAALIVASPGGRGRHELRRSKQGASRWPRAPGGQIGLEPLCLLNLYALAWRPRIP
eukprot:2143702-Prymnesium_polylepis.1